MPAKKLQKFLSRQTKPQETDTKSPKSGKAAGKKVSVEEVKPALKTSKVSDPADGFVRVNEIHIRKVYR